jgi:hypothetical protein
MGEWSREGDVSYFIFSGSEAFAIVGKETKPISD